MANVEGSVRMRRAGKLFVLGGLVSMLLATVMLLAASRLSSAHFGHGIILPLLLIYLGLFPAFAGVALWISGWIVEGFLLRDGRD
ncbi:MAG: hypothetical protein ABR910_10095 [Acidobacteriaceae bacterium]